MRDGTRADDAIDETNDGSFPASDAPGWTGMHAGPPLGTRGLDDAALRSPADRPFPVFSRLLLIGAILSIVAVGFLYAGGWLSPRTLTPSRFIDTFEQVNGKSQGFRRNHAKGMGLSGTFESNGKGARLSRAVVFQPGRMPVVGRFALAGGKPYVADGCGTSAAWRFRSCCPTARSGAPA
jgi:catalase